MNEHNIFEHGLLIVMLIFAGCSIKNLMYFRHKRLIEKKTPLFNVTSIRCVHFLKADFSLLIKVFPFLWYCNYICFFYLIYLVMGVFIYAFCSVFFISLNMKTHFVRFKLTNPPSIHFLGCFMIRNDVFTFYIDKEVRKLIY